uniref:Uncharacterized protein n=1 Tax=viral metagenome TaxID=1070528 RepID=A0A6C0DHS9_9ZZZZ
MSLAIYAAPFDNDSNNDYNNDNNLINKKRQTHNKTQKKNYNESFINKSQNFDKNKVNSILEKIHDKTEEESDHTGDDGEYSDNEYIKPNFDPPPKPLSSGGERADRMRPKEPMSNMYKIFGKAPQPNYEEENNLDLNNYSTNYGDDKSVEDYYKKMLPAYTGQKNPNNRPYYNQPANNGALNYTMNDVTGGGGNDVLLQKLNYMINLLEEKQDEKTNNVTEEVVLYSFLGIFIIFVVDSFARVGKYVR